MAARRTAGFAKYLARLGHPVTVLTSVVSGHGPIEGAVKTVRTPDLVATRLNWRRQSTANAGQGTPTGAVRGIEAHAVPDLALAGWLPFALPRALALARNEHFDCVITTSPPASSHLLGPIMQQLGLRWIADFRDGWTFDPPRPSQPLQWERRLDASLERSFVRRANAAIGVTNPIVEDLRERLEVDARLVSNGYDPEERGQAPPTPADELLSPERHSLVHTGRAGVSGRSPEVVFEALREMLRSTPDLPQRLEVIFAGALSQTEARLLADPRLCGVARTVGTLTRCRALALQQAADSLLVIAAGSSERSVATGKLFEYLTAGPPILVVGDRSEAARIVLQTGTGATVPADSPRAVSAGIASLMKGLPTKRNPKAIERYSWLTLGENASDLVEEVCARPSRPTRWVGRP